MKHLTILLSATALAALSLTACSADDLAGSSSETRPVTFTVTLTKGDTTTRSYLQEEGDDLSCYWQASDKILVTTPDGSRVGVLSLPANFEEAQTATFSSILDISGNPSQLNLIYYGNIPDLSIVNDSYSRSFASQDGTLASLSNYDFFSNTVDVTMSGNQAMAESTILERHTAFGRFRFTLNGERLSSKDLSVSVSGSNLATTAAINYKREVKFSDTGKSIVTKTNDKGEVWLTILPNEDADGKTNTTLVFDVEISGMTYEGVLDATHSWEAGQYVREVNETDYVYEGVEVALNEKEAENPGGEYGEDDPNYEDYLGEDTRNPLHKFAKYNLVRVGEIGSLENGFADSETENGALYQWGRNYGYMDDKGIYTNPYQLYIPQTDFINYAEAQGFMTYDLPNSSAKADFFAYRDENSYPSYYLSSGTGMHYNSSMRELFFDSPYSYDSAEDIVANPTKYFMDATPNGKLASFGSYAEGMVWHDNRPDYWISTFGDGGSTWTERAQKCGYDNDEPCPAGWRLPTEEEFAAIAPEGDGIDYTGNLGTALSNYAEVREYKGIRYAIRWIYNINYIQIECVVDPTVIQSKINSLYWDQHKDDKVVRKFPYTGSIMPLIMLGDGTMHSGHYELIVRPFHRGTPYRDIGLLTVGYYDQRYFVVDPEDMDGANEAFGGYWVADKGRAFRFQAGEKKGSTVSFIQMDNSGPVEAFAIRPVMDKK